MHTLLVTGATGAFGRVLLDTLAAREEVERIYALTHRATLSDTPAKVEPVCGDVTADGTLGLSADGAAALTATITGIVHAAADTRFTAPLDTLLATNVGGGAGIIAFARRCRRLTGLTLLSTVYVAGARTGAVGEDELEHSAGFVNAYEQSKYETEGLARQSMADVPLAVIRLSTVIGAPPEPPRPLGAIHQAIRLMYRSLAPMVPGRADHRVDLVPVEYAAPAVAWLATQGFAPGRTFHVVAGRDTIGVAELLDLTLETFVRCRPAWRTRAIARPALVDLETFALFRQSVDQVGDWVLRDSTAVIASFAPQLAYPKAFDDERCRTALAGSGIVCPPVRPVYAGMVQRLIGA